jgi:hypothetical protein
MFRAAALILALALAGPAMAQTTNCSQFGRTVTCRTASGSAASTALQSQLQQQQADLDAMMAQTAQAAQQSGASAYSWRDVPPSRCSVYDKLAASLAYCGAREVAANRKAVGDLMAAGKCDDALRGALGTGDLAFAREVRDFCATPRRPQQ